MNDSVWFFEDGKPGDYPFASVASSITPHVGSKISIKGKTWEVVKVNYALDYSDRDHLERTLRANVELKAVPGKQIRVDEPQRPNDLAARKEVTDLILGVLACELECSVYERIESVVRSVLRDRGL